MKSRIIRSGHRWAVQTKRWYSMWKTRGTFDHVYQAIAAGNNIMIKRV